MKFFDDLESHGYVYEHPEAKDRSAGYHVHISDGSPIYFPAVFRRSEESMHDDASGTERASMLVERVVTVEMQYTRRANEISYRVQVNVIGQTIGLRNSDHDLYTVDGFFDRKFNDIQNGKAVLDNCFIEKGLIE